MSSIVVSGQPFDQEMQDIVDYVYDFEVSSDLAYRTAWACLIDTLGCGFEALEYPACTKLLGPLVPGTTVECGARVPGTGYELDGRAVDILPLDADEIARCQPVYETLPGWSESTAGVTHWELLPLNARRYLERMQALTLKTILRKVPGVRKRK